MEEDKSAIELLKEFARKTDRKIDCSKKYYPTSTINPRFLSQSYSIIPNQETPTSFFISYCDLKQFGDFGIYITDEWLLDDPLIENLFTLSEKIRTELY
ncbi:MAG: hypothetical protein JEZ14_24780 [Marinilabiliaceae bacterium]|nr:hypothetical protein [Marinilabiliaceae bacterium]